MNRRQFVGLAGLATAGVWASASDSFAARFARGWAHEMGRESAPSPLRPDPAGWDSNRLTAAWLGHATVLVNFCGFTILTDPTFFPRVGVETGLGVLGRKRRVKAALAVRDLPPIDLVLLSHAHMDHLDLPSLRALGAVGARRVVTARATADLVEGTGLPAAVELDWGDRAEVESRGEGLSVRAFEVKHWGARWRTDTERGYNGYILERAGRRIIFGGDTSLCGHFASIRGDGPFEMAIMPIGSYRPGPSAHCTPEEAVRMANDAGAEKVFPVHHATFALGPEPAGEPLERLERALDGGRIAIRRIGETWLGG